MRFRTRQRLRADKDFLFVRKAGKRHSCAGFLGQAAINNLKVPEKRLGLKVTKKVGNAVTRNRLKRIFRELFRLHQEKLPERCDLVIVAYPSLTAMNYSSIAEDYIKLCSRIQPNSET